jgi:hypothetical protein
MTTRYFSLDDSLIGEQATTARVDFAAEFERSFGEDDVVFAIRRARRRRAAMSAGAPG